MISEPQEITASRGETRERYEINRGLLEGCAVYLSDQDRFSVRSGTFDREIHDKFTEFAEKSDVILDLGASEGFYSVYALKNTPAKVYSIEGSEAVVADLLLNLEENTRDAHRLQFGTNQPGKDGSSVDGMIGHERGRVFMKIDAPENEGNVLRGAEQILDREETTLIMRVSSKEAEQESMWILDEHGFDVSIIGPSWWRAIVKDRNQDDSSRWIIAEKAEIIGLFA